MAEAGGRVRDSADRERAAADLRGVLDALSDPCRLAIFDRLRSTGELPVGEIAAGQSLCASSVSRHITVLESAGVVNKRVDGRNRFISIQTSAVSMLRAWIERREEDCHVISRARLGEVAAPGGMENAP